MTNRERAAAVASGIRPARWKPYFGAIPEPDGVRFRVWAPEAQHVTLLLGDRDRPAEYAPQKGADGIWEILVPQARAGARYAYSIDRSEPRPDPVSRFQPEGVHNWSEVVDPSAFAWHDTNWRGVDPARVVLYELHVGTFSGNGTFAAVADRLRYLRDLGITAIELMPVADFPGRRNWGYDGGSLFAPSRAYGRPDDLRALVDGAHALDLAVILDVVYNHLGPEGSYLPFFSPAFLTDAHVTPWGNAINLDKDGSLVVRRLLIENALHWIHEYHADGLRLDATHALIDDSDRPFVAELTAAVHAARERPPLVYAEDHRNLAMMVTSADRGGWELDGVWADDFHHVVRRMLAGDAHSYFVDYEGNAGELAEILRRGWLFIGQTSRHHQAPRGTDPSEVPMRKAVICVQNHDQVGNRALGDRLHHSVGAAEWRAAVTLLLTAPMTPLLFMGQEWAARTPFQFFTDFEPSLGEKVLEGRRREFHAFPGFDTAAGAERIPNPQADETFEASRLQWTEQALPEHANVLAMHRVLLHLRAARPALQASNESTCDARALDDSTILLKRSSPESAGTVTVVCARLRGSGDVNLGFSAIGRWRTLFSTEDERFTSDPQPVQIAPDLRAIAFARPGAVILEIDAGAGAA